MLLILLATLYVSYMYMYICTIPHNRLAIVNLIQYHLIFLTCILLGDYYTDCLNPGTDTLSIGGLPRNKSFRTFRKEFQLEDACDFIVSGADVSPKLTIPSTCILLPIKLYSVSISIVICSSLELLDAPIAVK